MQAHPFEVEQIAMRFRVPRAPAAMMLLAQMTAQPMTARAQGGDAPAGSPVVVGERGPEVFVPQTPGTVVPLPRSRPPYMRLPRGIMGEDQQAPMTPEDRQMMGLWPRSEVPSDTQWLKEHPWWGASPVPGSLGVSLGYNDIPPPGHGGPWKWNYGILFPGADYTPEERSAPWTGSPDMMAKLVRPGPWDEWLESRPESTNVEDLRTPEERKIDDDLMHAWGAPRLRHDEFPWTEGKGDLWRWRKR
jgi:hypothetical protein